MTLANSGAPSNSDGPKKRRRRLWPPILIAVVGLILALGPTIVLNVLLARIPATEGGPTLEYGQARAGFLFRWITVTDLTVAHLAADESRTLAIDHLRLDNLSFFNVVGLLRDPFAPHPEARPLADDFSVQGLSLTRDGRRLASAKEVGGRDLVLAPAPAGRAGSPLWFGKLDVLDLDVQEPLARVELSRLEARGLGPEFLDGLTVRGLNLAWGPEGANRPNLNLGGLTLGGLDIEAVLRAVTEGEKLLPLWVLSVCETLDLAQGVFTLGTREAVVVKSARFDYQEADKGGGASFARTFDFSADLPALISLAEQPRDPFWSGLRDLAGDRVAGEMALRLDFNRHTGQAALKSARLEIPTLGRLELTGDLAGVKAMRPHLSPSQFLFGAGAWRLHGLSLTFADQGFMANYYRHLDRTVFRHAPQRPTPANIMEYFISPLARTLEDEAGFSNLPALVSETEAFLSRPARLSLTAAPAEPLSVTSLANLDKYDIIEKLCLTIQVNDRAPVAVGVASGVFHERLPSAPKPMENLFEEEDI